MSSGERLQTIAELVISPYSTISQQFLGFKKLSFVGGITTLCGHEWNPIIRYIQVDFF